MKQTTNRLVALGTLSAMTLGSAAGMLTTTGTAQAGSSTYKKLAIAGGVVTGYGLLKHKKGLAIAGAVGTGAAYYAYKKSKKKEQRHSRLWYQRRYGRNWRSHYRG